MPSGAVVSATDEAEEEVDSSEAPFGGDVD
jgi:hypothetical protein